MCTLGPQIVEALTLVTQKSIELQSFENQGLDDTMLLIQCAIPSLKMNVAQLLQNAIAVLFQKASQSRIPESNTSDIEKNLIESHSLFVRTLHVMMEELGFCFFVGNTQILSPLLDYVQRLIFVSVEEKDKKHALKTLKIILLGTFGPQSGFFTKPCCKVLASKKVIQSWSSADVQQIMAQLVLPEDAKLKLQQYVGQACAQFAVKYHKNKDIESL